MARVDVAQFVSKHAREFGFRVRKREQSARDVNVARQGEGVDDRTVKRRDDDRCGRLIARRDQAPCDSIDIGFQRGVFNLAAELGEDRRMLLFADGFFLIAGKAERPASGGAGRYGERSSCDQSFAQAPQEFS